ncbi:MAG: uroporphyrinogen-III C-methyltransferase [Gammaproteobacteria bacterium]|nr:uroporphyrinogen-III C-methyltransferase [Gammaproteobacteria bacterium]
MSDDNTSKKTPDKKVHAGKTSATGKTEGHAKSGQGSTKGAVKSDANSQANSKSSSFISGFMLVAIAISIVGIFILWQQQQEDKKKNRQQLQTQSQLISVLESEVKKYTQSQDQFRGEIDSKVTTEINEIERSIADIKELGSKNHRDWILSESEYLLRIANHRLQLEGDINTTIKALRIVDSKIMSLKDPSLLPVRKQLADEISALESTRLPDIHGMVLTLDSLQAMSPKMGLKISMLPKVAKEGTPTDDAHEITIKDWELVLNKIWNELKTLVVIKRHDQSLAPILTVEQQQTLRHILQLKIQGIRTALLNKQAELFMESLKDTLSWLQEHFNKDDPDVVLLESRLQEFQTVQLDVRLPEISGSLHALRSIQKQLKNKAGSTIPPKKPVDTNNISKQQDEQVKI